MKVEFLEESHLEYLEAIEFYNLQDDRLGAKFKTEIDKTIRIISNYPESYPQYSERSRKAKTNLFPYNIIFSNYKNVIIIIAIAHQHRKPKYWENR